LDLKSEIRNIKDFPKPGIVFRDITTLLKNPDAMKYVISQFKEYYKDKKVDLIVGPESRGFIFGSLLAHELHVPFAPLRKPGKLPAETEKEEYELEYGTDAIEIHKDAINQGDNILIVDDLIATGGTCEAAAKLIERLGGNVLGFAFLIELSFLNPREKLKNYDIFSLIEYKEE